jgi:hypothetical protein
MPQVARWSKLLVCARILNSVRLRAQPVSRRLVFAGLSLRLLVQRKMAVSCAVTLRRAFSGACSAGRTDGCMCWVDVVVLAHHFFQHMKRTSQQRNYLPRWLLALNLAGRLRARI